jgi:4-aminobutyrate aminotransferase-like enzyme
MIGAEIVEDKESKKPGIDMSKEIMFRCWRRGIVLVTGGACILRIAPALNVTEEMVDKALDIIEDVIKEVNDEK